MSRIQTEHRADDLSDGIEEGGFQKVTSNRPEAIYIMRKNLHLKCNRGIPLSLHNEKLIALRSRAHAARDRR